MIGWPAKPEKPGQPKVLGMTVDELTQLVASLEAENEELRAVAEAALAYCGDPEQRHLDADAALDALRAALRAWEKKP